MIGSLTNLIVSPRKKCVCIISGATRGIKYSSCTTGANWDKWIRQRLVKMLDTKGFYFKLTFATRFNSATHARTLWSAQQFMFDWDNGSLEGFRNRLK